MIVDAHAHIGSFRGYDIGESILMESMQESRIAFAIVSNLDGAGLKGITGDLDETAANQATLKFVQGHPKQFRGLLWARPENGDPAKLQAFLDGERGVFVGIKFHPEFNRYTADDPRLDPYLQLCEKYELVAVFHCGRNDGNSAPEKIYAAARRHPTVPFVLYHMGFFGPHDAAVAVAKRAKQQRDALLYLETAQAAPDAVLSAIRTLGSEHVLFGTDATYYGKQHYSRYDSMLRLLQNNLTGQEYANVTAGNAIKLFRLRDFSR